jgi:hypothetical protein
MLDARWKMGRLEEISSTSDISITDTEDYFSGHGIHIAIYCIALWVSWLHSNRPDACPPFSFFITCRAQFDVIASAAPFVSALPLP